MPRRISVGLIAFALTCGAHADEVLTVRDAWIREAPPGAEVLAAYMTIHNPTTATQRITSVNSAAFGHIEIHRSDITGGMARMDVVENVSIAPGASLTLQPNGMHMMLSQPKAPVHAGDHVKLHLFVTGGRSVNVDVEVRKLDTVEEHHHTH